MRKFFFSINGKTLLTPLFLKQTDVFGENDTDDEDENWRNWKADLWMLPVSARGWWNGHHLSLYSIKRQSIWFAFAWTLAKYDVAVTFSGFLIWVACWAGDEFYFDAPTTDSLPLSLPFGHPLAWTSIDLRWVFRKSAQVFHRLASLRTQELAFTCVGCESAWPGLIYNGAQKIGRIWLAVSDIVTYCPSRRCGRGAWQDSVANKNREDGYERWIDGHLSLRHDWVMRVVLMGA